MTHTTPRPTRRRPDGDLEVFTGHTPRPPPPPEREPFPATSPWWRDWTLWAALAAWGGVLALIASHTPKLTSTAPATPVPMAVGMAGECPIFHARGRDGSETYTLTCAPGARLGPLQLKGRN